MCETDIDDKYLEMDEGCPKQNSANVLHMVWATLQVILQMPQ